MNDDTQVSENEAEFMKALVDRVNTGKHSDFIFLRSIEELIYAFNYRRGMRRIIRYFKRVHKKLLKEYVSLVKNGMDRIELILAVKDFENCIKYFEQEIQISNDIMDEYKAYVWNGHIISTILGIPRSEDDLRDFRGNGYDK